MNNMIEKMNFPKRLDPHHKIRTPNGNISLCLTTATIETKNNKLKIKGQIVFSLNPNLDIQFTAVEPIRDIETILLLLDDSTTLMIDEFPDAEWMIYSTNPVSAFLRNKIHQLTNQQVESLFFFIVNIPDILGDTFVVQQNKVTLSRVTLRPANWQITMDSLFTKTKVKEFLRKNSGYAITQIGRLEKNDKGLFDIEDGMAVLNEFGDFLGFANGKWTPIILIEGFIDNNRVFFDWKSPSRCNKWEYRNSWLDEDHAQAILDEGLTKYLALQSKPLWSSVLSRVVYLYVLSNNTKFVEGSLMIAQPVLELLAWNYLVEQEKAISKTGYNESNASKRFEMMLDKLNIPIEIPKEFDELNKWSKQHEITNGAEAITRIRNNLVHPENGKNKSLPNGRVIYEAKELALWYIEMTILSICDYDGVYSNRLKIRWVGQVEYVPWKLE